MSNAYSHLLTDAEVERLIQALANGSKKFTEADAQMVIDWAERVRVDEGLLDMALQNKMGLCVEKKGRKREILFVKDGVQK